jgi:hypothetical protein
LVVRGKVIAGISGCTTPDTGGGCFLTAHDAETGKELWRTHSIARPGDPADASWNGVPLPQRKGGSLWGTGSYDPELNLIFWGTAPPFRTPSSRAEPVPERTSIPTRRWRSTPTPAGSSGISSIYREAIGISITPSSACWSMLKPAASASGWC